MSMTFFSTSETSDRRVDFGKIVDTIAVIGLFGLIFLWYSAHKSAIEYTLATIAELLAVAASIALHYQCESARERQWTKIYRLTPQTLNTLKAVNVPADVIEGLEILVGGPDLLHDAFCRDIQRGIGVARWRECRQTILRYAETIPE